MAKIYKRKWIQDENSSDSRDNTRTSRKYYNSSERQRGKTVAVSGTEDYLDRVDPDLIRELRWNLESKLSDECWRDQQSSSPAMLNNMLWRIGLGNFKLNELYKCDCIDPSSLSDEEILKLSGL